VRLKTKNNSSYVCFLHKCNDVQWKTTKITLCFFLYSSIQGVGGDNPTLKTLLNHPPNPTSSGATMMPQQQQQPAVAVAGVSAPAPGVVVGGGGGGGVVVPRGMSPLQQQLARPPPPNAVGGGGGGAQPGGAAAGTPQQQQQQQQMMQQVNNSWLLFHFNGTNCVGETSASGHILGYICTFLGVNYTWVLNLCSLDEQWTVSCNDFRIWCAAKFAAYLSSALHVVLYAFSMNVIFSFRPLSDLRTQ
jgi:hypothetical protein